MESVWMFNFYSIHVSCDSTMNESIQLNLNESNSARRIFHFSLNLSLFLPFSSLRFSLLLILISCIFLFPSSEKTAQGIESSSTLDFSKEFSGNEFPSETVSEYDTHTHTHTLSLSLSSLSLPPSWNYWKISTWKNFNQQFFNFNFLLYTRFYSMWSMVSHFYSHTFLPFSLSPSLSLLCESGANTKLYSRIKSILTTSSRAEDREGVVEF